ncbi:SufE family protein [Ancylomarina sp. 16SWW S1-10-2]|uniref:SufE family protein n=1 Tax=Ancylomarina sp. 16SWW S1-10-2 TaxID=2499681 RepID=UPI0012ADA706|nr:SufE family protein [Ancylomarina sp. 16SWW S1-10-2]MRT92315.1 SufE family protein [Ancylomarina sp. 16SWW S1-10-2]
MTIKEIQEEIIEEFVGFDDWMDKYAYLIELGTDLSGLESQYQTDQNLIKGCQSKVWFNAKLEDGVVKIEADSDAIIVKGIAALLIRVFNNQTPEAIMNADLHFIDEIGLKQHLSPTRSNGLVAMVKQIKMYGLAFNQKMNN